MEWAPWGEQSATWPVSGSSILAAHDDAHITVYQAYNDAIADAAVCAQHLCVPAFRLGRMSWIKTNFLWMAARSGWGTKPNQTRVLAITLRRPFFDALLAAAVPTCFAPSARSGRGREGDGGDDDDERARWARALRAADVLVQWDPDHLPEGGRHPHRRAVQLGLRGDALRRYASPAYDRQSADSLRGGDARGNRVSVDSSGLGGGSDLGGWAGIVRIEDVSARVAVERAKLATPGWGSSLCTPRERVYKPKE